MRLSSRRTGECERAVVRAIHETNVDELLRDLNLPALGGKRRAYIAGTISATLQNVHDSRGFSVDGRRVGVAGTRWRAHVPVGVLERTGGGVAAIDGFELTFDSSFGLLVRIDHAVEAQAAGPRAIAPVT